MLDLLAAAALHWKAFVWMLIELAQIELVVPFWELPVQEKLDPKAALGLVKDFAAAQLINLKELENIEQVHVSSGIKYLIMVLIQ